MVHRTFKVLNPEGEIAVVQRPEGVVEFVIYPKTGDNFEFRMARKDAFDFAMELLQHLYRLGPSE
ncbi:MAG: hypothetical protein PHW74_04965 [Desulfobacca sp.]|nr:hypothetical protein [Desulfobacca sp.]